MRYGTAFSSVSFYLIKYQQKGKFRPFHFIDLATTGGQCSKLSTRKTTHLKMESDFLDSDIINIQNLVGMT